MAGQLYDAGYIYRLNGKTKSYRFMLNSGDEQIAWCGYFILTAGTAGRENILTVLAYN